MKTFRMFFCHCMLIVLILDAAGCATTTKESKTSDDSIRTEAAKKWDDMSPAERAGTVLWYPFQYALYFGGSALGGH
jgi:hypothetical protein